MSINLKICLSCVLDDEVFECSSVRLCSILVCAVPHSYEALLGDSARGDSALGVSVLSV